jgi:mono/diheme cytochrome c family protein
MELTTRFCPPVKGDGERSEQGVLRVKNPFSSKTCQAAQVSLAGEENRCHTSVPRPELALSLSKGGTAFRLRRKAGGSSAQNEALLSPFLLFTFYFLLLLLPGCTALDPNPEATVTNPPQATDTIPQSGEGLYRFYCAGCHGLHGIPTAAGISGIKGYSQPFHAFDSVLTIGPGLMPRFPELDSAQRQRIYDYVRSF